jgi:hypothetical protein
MLVSDIRSKGATRPVLDQPSSRTVTSRLPLPRGLQRLLAALAAPATPRTVAAVPVAGVRWLGTPLALFAVALAVYLLSNAGRGQPYNQFVLLADAFLHGRLDVPNAPPWLEMAHWHGRTYVIYPPLPAVLLLPLVAVFGTELRQELVSITLGAANVALCYAVIVRFFGNRTVALWTALLYGFGTVQWYHAQNGAVWYYAQVTAMFFLWLALLECATRGRLLLIGAALGLAYLARLPVILAAVFPVVYFWDRFTPLARTEGGGVRLRLPLRAYVTFGAGLAVAIALNAAYNYARFGVVHDFAYQLMPNFDKVAWFRHGLTDIRYVPENMRAMMTALPAFQGEPPYVLPRVWAMAIWVTTPAFFLIPLARWRSRLCLGAGLAALAIVIPILIHGGSGFTQFGFRYQLDFMPFLLILTASALTPRVAWWERALIGVCIAINLWGVVMLGFLNRWTF